MAAVLLSAAVAAHGAALAQTPALPLALATFDEAWSIVNRTYYDPAFRGVNWQAVRDELRPEAGRARTPAALRATITRMLGRLGESHFAVLPQFADPGIDADSVDRSGSPGFEVRPDAGSLLITRIDRESPAHRAGLRAGDRLGAVHGMAVSAIAVRLPEALEPRVRALELWRAGMMRLRGPAGSRATVTVQQSGGRSREVSFARVEEPGQTVLLGNLPPLRLRVDAEAAETPSGAAAGVIGFNVWMAAADAPFAAAVDRFRGARGIVIDLRGNPGGLAGMIMGISGHFFRERTALGTMKMRTSELTFFANPRASRPDGSRVEPYAGPVAILVDGLTGSASECFAGGMQSVGRARVFGETSMGQALPASFTRLPNGDTLLHAIADFVTADGTRLEGRGVVPDQAVPLDAAALAAGRDPVLAAALAWIDARSEAGR
ncbi:MAG: S41 family peptidase [Acidobacteriota bacterium]|nr:S41 family peptidase [Acidobacteriota bacterium]